jgi:hypothetical protein
VTNLYRVLSQSCQEWPTASSDVRPCPCIKWIIQSTRKTDKDTHVKCVYRMLFINMFRPLSRSSSG